MRFLPCLVAVLSLHLPALAQSTLSVPAQTAQVRVQLPSGWEAKKPQHKQAVQCATYPDLPAYFELFVESKADFAERVDLMAWAKRVRENNKKNSILVNRKDTELRERKIGDRTTVEYEVTGELKGQRLHFRNILLQVGDTYCWLMCWTAPSHWDSAQPKFDVLVSRLK